MKKALSLILIAITFMLPIGCTKADFDKAVSLIAAELPTVVQLANTILSLYGDAGEYKVPATELQSLQNLIAAYQAHPSNSSFQQIAAMVDQLVTQGDQDLLAAAQIKDPVRQQQVTTVLAAFDITLHIIDGYVLATQSTAQVQAKAAARRVKLKQLSQFYSLQDKLQVENAFHQPYEKVYNQAISMGF